MERQDYAFLRALYSAMNFGRVTELEADRVNDLANSVGLTPTMPLSWPNGSSARASSRSAGAEGSL